MSRQHKHIRRNEAQIFGGKKPVTLVVDGVLFVQNPKYPLRCIEPADMVRMVFDGKQWVEETENNSMQNPIRQEVIDGKLYVQYPAAATHITVNVGFDLPKDRHPVTLEKLDYE